MAYKPTVIRQFKGLSQNLALTAGSPEYALDCVNVIPSISGLAKLRVPTDLSTAPSGIGTGPDQFAMFSGNSKKVLNFFGQAIYIATLDDFTMSLFDSNPDYAGIAPWSVIMSNDFAFMQNGTSDPLKYIGSFPLQLWGIEVGATPEIAAFTGTGITLTVGRKYRIAYKNSTTGHVGTASPPSDSTGPQTDKTITVQLDAIPFADAQIDSARIYATLDGGGDFFFLDEIVMNVTPGFTGFPFNYLDSTPDTGLDQSERAPLINDVPPKAKYLCQWGGRIFMFNLPAENKKWVAYTGFNRIFVGRPEEACPPLNRIKMETGADEIAGGGVIEAGVIVFDNSHRMFMMRGQPEDITVTAPVEFTLILKQLPWNIGCASHFTIQSTPRGLVWLSSSLDIFLFDGQSQPVSIDEGAEPILRSINFSAVANSRSVYWQYKGRNWYILAVPTGTSTDLNTILIVDLEPVQEKNFGIVPLDLTPFGSFQSIGVVEMQSGEQKLVIGQNGKLKELTVTPTTRNGIEQNITSTTGNLGAFWKSGAFGNDSPDVEKFVRWTRVTSDNGGIRVKTEIFRDEITNPEIIEFQELPTGGKLSINRKARMWTHEIRFRDEDVSQNILQVVNESIPVAQR